MDKPLIHPDQLPDYSWEDEIQLHITGCIRRGLTLQQTCMDLERKGIIAGHGPVLRRYGWLKKRYLEKKPSLEDTINRVLSNDKKTN